MTFEIEQKYHIDDPRQLELRLGELGATELNREHHSDRYYNHPCRDFRETREALRVRRVDGMPRITYKGPKLPGTIKARIEREWRLDPGDPDGGATEELLGLLGFHAVAEVRKWRRCFDLPPPWDRLSVVIDEVEGLGWFTEVEQVVAQEREIEEARRRIGQLGDRLGLRRSEPRSYLTMLVELTGSESLKHP